MALTPQEFLRRVQEEEPQTFEGGIAKKLLRYLEDEFNFGNPDEDAFEAYREVLLKESDAIADLHRQFLREEYDAYRSEGSGEEEEEEEEEER